MLHILNGLETVNTFNEILSLTHKCMRVYVPFSPSASPTSSPPYPQFLLPFGTFPYSLTKDLMPQRGVTMWLLNQVNSTQFSHLCPASLSHCQKNIKLQCHLHKKNDVVR